MGDFCSLSCVRYLVLAFNVVFWLAGGAVMGVGIWMRVGLSQYDVVVGSIFYPLTGYILIGAGAVALLVGFAGCIGAIRENKCLTGMYSGLLFLIFAAEVTAAILAYFFFDEVRITIDNRMNLTIQTEYGNTKYKDSTTAIDLMQQQLQCCGDRTYSDWLNSKYYKDPVFESSTRGTSVPRSCCFVPTDVNCNEGYPIPSHPDKIYKKGCVPQFEVWLKENLLIIGGIGLGIAMIQLLGVIFSCCLFKAIDDKEEMM